MGKVSLRPSWGN